MGARCAEKHTRRGQKKSRGGGARAERRGDYFGAPRTRVQDVGDDGVVDHEEHGRVELCALGLALDVARDRVVGEERAQARPVALAQGRRQRGTGLVLVDDVRELLDLAAMTRTHFLG